MSSGSGSTSRVANRKPKPLGVDEDRFSTNEQAKPVPYFAGKLRLACQFISDVFDVRKASHSATSGKQAGKGGQQYFASFAALIAHGPIDAIHQVILNGDQVWPEIGTEDSIERDISNPDFVDLTIDGFGIVRFYWGTETQPDDDYIRIKSGITHPPYKGMSYLVAHQLFLGFNQTNVQNLEVIASRYPELGSSPRLIGEDANPAHVLYELLTHPRLGRGFDASLVDAAALEALGEQLEDELIGISPKLDTQRDAIGWIVSLLEYIDGYPIISPEGLLSFGTIRPRLPAGLPEIDETVMVDPPNVNPEDWSTTFNETNVKFTSPTQKYDPDAKTWRDRGNFQITGQLNTQTLERTWITNPAVAEFMATAIGRVTSLPEVTGQISLRLTALFEQLTPGAGFLLTYPPRGYDQIQCIVTERNVPDPARPVYQISFRVDRSYLLAGLEVQGGGSGGSGEDPIVVAQIEHMRLIQLPDDLSPEPDRIHVAALCSRPETLTVGFVFHLGQNYDFSGSGTIPALTYDPIASHDRFAWRGELMEAYASGTPTTDELIGIAVRLTGPDVELPEATEFDGLFDDLLVFIGDEICSVFLAQLIGVDEYRLFVIRERFGTAQGSYAAGDEAFIVRREDILGIRHAVMEPTRTVNAKLQAVSGQGQADLSAQTEIDLAIV